MKKRNIKLTWLSVFTILFSMATSNAKDFDNFDYSNNITPDLLLPMNQNLSLLVTEEHSNYLYQLENSILENRSNILGNIAGRTCYRPVLRWSWRWGFYIKLIPTKCRSASPSSSPSNSPPNTIPSDG